MGYIASSARNVLRKARIVSSGAALPHFRSGQEEVEASSLYLQKGFGEHLGLIYALILWNYINIVLPPSLKAACQAHDPWPMMAEPSAPNFLLHPFWGWPSHIIHIFDLHLCGSIFDQILAPCGDQPSVDRRGPCFHLQSLERFSGLLVGGSCANLLATFP